MGLLRREWHLQHADNSTSISMDRRHLHADDMIAMFPRPTSPSLVETSALEPCQEADGRPIPKLDGLNHDSI